MRKFLTFLALVAALMVWNAFAGEMAYVPTNRMYALLVGGGITKCDTFESYYRNIEYVSNSLNKLGYHDKNIKILFYGGKTPNHPIVEDDATKENFVNELKHLGNVVDSNDSLLIFRSGHGMVELTFQRHGTLPKDEHQLKTRGIKCSGTAAVMKFPDGDLSYLELQKILERIRGKQIVVILNQCFSTQFADIAKSLKNTVVITETRENELAINQTRKTLRWKHNVWPFVKCIFDGFLKNDGNNNKQSVYNAFQYLLRCNPNIEGVPVKADRPLLKENPHIVYGSSLKKGDVYIN